MELEYVEHVVLSIRSNHKENTGDLIIEKRTFDNSAIDTIKNLLKCTDWQSLYNTNVHEMFQIITDKVTEYINICAPLKKYKIPQKYIKREKWITQGILKSSNTLDKLRKKSTGHDMNDTVSLKFRHQVIPG